MMFFLSVAAREGGRAPSCSMADALSKDDMAKCRCSVLAPPGRPRRPTGRSAPAPKAFGCVAATKHLTCCSDRCCLRAGVLPHSLSQSVPDRYRMCRHRICCRDTARCTRHILWAARSDSSPPALQARLPPPPPRQRRPPMSPNSPMTTQTSPGGGGCQAPRRLLSWLWSLRAFVLSFCRQRQSSNHLHPLTV
jgi:hypothetical protein